MIDADSVGHEILTGPGLDPVAERWPWVVREGKIDRPRLAGIVFSDLSELRELESITHPLIFGKIQADLEGFRGLAVVEVPILTGFAEWPRMVVDAPDAARFARSIARGMEPGDVSKRMAAQPTRSEWLASADMVIPNHGSVDDLRSTIERLLAHIGVSS
jgi:dephospho-CoA kinase